MKINCLICKSDSDFLFSKDDWGNNFKFYKCRNCTHVFIFPQPSIVELNGYYNQDYYVPEFQRLKVRKKGEYLLKFLMNKDLPMLEIGCSYGYFLEYMREQGIEVEGLELSQRASQSAKDKGFEVICGNIEDQALVKVYRNIFLFDVLEHILSPLNFLGEISKKLEVNGNIYLTVPNQDSLEYKMFKKYWEWATPPAHLHFFSFKSISELFIQNGFKIEVLTSFKGDSTGNIFYQLYDYLKRVTLFNLGFLIYGKAKFLEKKKKYNLQQKDKRQFNKTELKGLNYCILQVSKIFNFVDRLFRNKLNEPTLFLKATKNETR